MINLVIIFVLALLAGLAMAKIVRNRKNGGGCSCGGGCGSCAGCGLKK